MPEQTTEHKKAAITPSLCAKAAGAAFAVAVALFICIYLVATLPGKSNGWQSALPTAVMSEEDAQTAFARARYLHEAEVRPKLIRAGFLNEADVGAYSRGWYGRHDESESFQLTEALWTMRAFPEMHASFLQKLTDTTVPLNERTAYFYTMGGFLSTIADVVADGKNARDFHYRDYSDRYYRSSRAPGWFAYFAEDPRVNIRYTNRSGYSARKSQKAPDGLGKRAYEQNLAFAERVLPFVHEQVLAGWEDRKAEVEANSQNPAGETASDKAKRRYEESRSTNLGRYLQDISEKTGEAVAAMAARKGDAGFFPLVRELMACKQGTVQQRFAAVPLIAKRPGLPAAEYLFWQKYESDLDSIARCVGTNPSSYAYLIGCCDKLGVLTKNMMKERGSFVIGGQSGSGVSLTRTETFLPAGSAPGNLYLLADMAQALQNAPAYDVSRATPVFQGHLFRHLRNQPLVLPLNPKNADDAALIAWYAATGWKEGRTLLFSAAGTPSQVAAHWASIHLLWWPSSKKKADAEPDLAYMHPESGHFWMAILPRLKGKAVARFLGPVTAMWFGRESVDKHGWVDEKYEARPEAAPSVAGRTGPLTSPLLTWATGSSQTGEPEKTKKPYSETTATVVLGREVRAATGDTFAHAYRIRLAKHLQKKYPDAETPPLAAFAFVDATMEMLKEWKITGGRDVTAASEYLWRFRSNPDIEKRVHEILSNKDLRPYERLRKVRRALGLPAEKNTGGGC